MSTVLDLTVASLAQGIAVTLPSRWDFTIAEPADGVPTLPENPTALTWTVGEYLLAVAIDQGAADVLVEQDNAVDAALDGPVGQAAAVLSDLVGGAPLDVGSAQLVDDLQGVLKAADGETRWVQLLDGDEHRATIAIRLVVTDAMREEAGATAPTPSSTTSTPQAAQGNAAPVSQSIGQQAGTMSGQSQGSRTNDGFESPIVPGINPNDLPSSLGRTPGDAPMMPPNAVAHPAEFAAFDDYGQLGGTPHPMALLSDVELGVTAELGRTRLTVRDVLALTPGSIIELDRSAGAPVDVVVNGTLIARGEVVVIDEEFGVRITQIMGMPDLAKANALELASEG
ncbi:flagellar motor switch protein FliN [Stomatohabitans albus]|uniref:flagellar motor switch protein FliN n=1 Tax=Stomatohabitans albus TaxID=3110766 RepID=UPI00300D8E79